MIPLLPLFSSRGAPDLGVGEATESSILPELYRRNHCKYLHDGQDKEGQRSTFKHPLLSYFLWNEVMATAAPPPLIK